MQLLRVLKNTYELLDTTDIVRLAKSTLRDMGSYALATRLLDASGDLVVVPVFVGGGLEPSANGTDNLVTMKPGLALWYDSSVSDIFLGEVTPVFFDTAQTAAFTTNTDGSGDDRIDVLSVRPLEVEEDPQLRKFKDPISQTISQKLSPQRVRKTFEFVVTEGVPAPSPSAPVTPAGTFKVCEVLRVNAQADVNAVDVTDSRVLDRTRTGFLESFSGIATKLGALYFGDSAGTHYRIERDSDTAPTKLRTRNSSGAAVDLEVGSLAVSSSAKDVAANSFRAFLNTGGLGIISFFDDDSSEQATLVAKNAPFAQARFGWNDPGGAIPDNDPADEITGAFNIASILWQIVATDFYAEITLTTALPTIAGTIVHVTPGGSVGGTTVVLPALRAQAEVISTTVIRVYFTGASNALVEPIAAGTPIRNAITIYNGDI